MGCMLDCSMSVSYSVFLRFRENVHLYQTFPRVVTDLKIQNPPFKNVWSEAIILQDPTLSGTVTWWCG